MKQPPSSLRSLLVGLGLGAACIGTVLAAPTQLRIGTSSAPTSLDPHFHNLGPNNMVAAHVFDALFDLDEQFRLRPALAEGYRQIDATSWEIKLRHGVKFHDGSTFDANDVLFSLCRVPTVQGSPGPFTVFTRSIKYLHAPDPYTLVLRTNGPNPNLLRELAVVRIISDGLIQGEKVYYADNGCRLKAPWPTREQFDSGTAAIGTGPFMLAQPARREALLLRRNPAYWGAQPAWDEVTLHSYKSAADRVAALLSDGVDVIENPPTDQVDAIQRDGRHKVVRRATARAIYLVMDQRSPQAPGGVLGTDGRNPFRDEGVRRALSLALDRQALVRSVLNGFGEPAEQLLGREFFGAHPGLPPLAYDPERARQLLAWAGYGKGFELTLRAPNGRYMNDAKVAEAIAQMLGRIGLRTRVELLPPAEFFARGAKLDVGLSLWGFGATTGEMSAVLKAVVASRIRDKGWGTANQGGFSQISLDLQIDEAATTMDDAHRATLLGRASQRAVEAMAVVPLYFEVTPWALRADLDYAGRPDQHTRAAEISPRVAPR